MRSYEGKTYRSGFMFASKPQKMVAKPARVIKLALSFTLNLESLVVIVEE